jgi:SAM-dependent methyltransferase
MPQPDAVFPSSPAESLRAGALSVAAEFAALLPPETLPLLTTRRWAEALTITEPRVVNSGAAARDWHAHGMALLGLRRFAEGGVALDHGTQLGPDEPTTGRSRTRYARMMEAYALAARGLAEDLACGARDGEAWMRAQPASLRILDLGCGTGLSGPLFRPFAAYLAGVDLAPRMLDIAAAKGCYDRLDAGEITAFLRSAAGPPHDLIIATDVVMYFGEIAALLETVSGALRSGGRFGFTVEAHDAPGHRLYPTGRYKHERGWVERQAAEAGFAVMAVEKTMIRLEGGVPVAGWLFLLERPHAS